MEYSIRGNVINQCYYTNYTYDNLLDLVRTVKSYHKVEGVGVVVDVGSALVYVASDDLNSNEVVAIDLNQLYYSVNSVIKF